MRRYIIYSIIAITIITTGICTYKHIKNTSYRKSIPALPPLDGFSKTLVNQIQNGHNDAIDDPNSKNIGTLGMIYYSSNHYDLAITCFNLAADRDQNNWVWPYYEACVHAEFGNSKAAISCFEKVLMVNPDVTIASYKIAELYQQIGKADSAEQVLIQLLKREKKDFTIQSKYRTQYYKLPVYAQMLLARIYVNNQEYGKAQTQLENVASNYKSFGPAFKQLGALHNRLGNAELSNKYTIRSNDLMVFNFPIDTLMDKITLISCSDAYLLKQVDIATRGSDPRWTVEVINVALKNIKGNKYLLDKAIKQYLFMGVGKYILSYLDQHYEMHKDSWEDLEKMGIELANAGHQKEALKYFKRVKKLDIDTKQKSMLAGLLYEKVNQKEEAIEYMSEVLKEDSNNPLILIDAISLYLQANKIELATKYLNRLKYNASQFPKYYLLEGLKQETIGNMESAISLYEKGFSLGAQHEPTSQRLGTYYETNNDWKTAIKFYEDMLNLYPNSAYLQERLGSILIGCPDKKLRDINKGMELAERSFYHSKYTPSSKVSAARSLAIAYYGVKDARKCDFYINEAIKLADKSKFEPGYIRGLVNLSKQFNR